VPGVCDWANEVFATRFPPEPTMHAPGFAPLDANRAPEAGVPAVAVLDLDDVGAAGDVCVEEAARIARVIRAEVDAGRRAFGDFLILTRRKKALQPYADALERLEVPIEVTGAGAFGESAEVRHLALLITALADPQDAVALTGVLRGPLFGLSDGELFAYRQAGGWLGLFSDGVEDSPVAAALARLRHWHTWTRRLPAGAALERILEDSGYLALAATSPGGVEAGDLLHAIDRVRAVVEQGFTLAEAAEALAAWSGLDEDGPEESSDVDSLPLEPGRRDVVRLMNLHKAKGLEAAVVFLADPLGGFEPRADVRILRGGRADAAADGRGGADVAGAADAGAVGCFQIVDGAGYGARVLAEPTGWEKHEADERAYLDAEVDRLLYVAATRARDLLVVGRWTGRAGNRTPAWDAFHPFLTGAPAVDVPARVAAPARAEVDLSAPALAAATAALAARHAHARVASWSACSVTSEAKRLPRVTIDVPETTGEDPTRVLVADTTSRRADAGAAWGTLVHGLLEHAMRHPGATREDLRRLALWLTIEEPPLRALVERAIDTVAAVARDEFWRRAQDAPERHEEAPFSVLEAPPAGLQTPNAGPDPGPIYVPNVLSGTIDLAYRDGDEWRVVDYKTDADATTADLASRHQAQLTAYERAWSRLAGRRTTARVVGAR
jgi:ATP-dependent helicase/nuclease subunit A